MSDTEYDPGEFVIQCVDQLLECNPNLTRDRLFMDVLYMLNGVKHVRDNPQFAFVLYIPGSQSGVMFDILKHADGVGVERPYTTQWTEDEELMILTFEPV